MEAFDQVVKVFLETQGFAKWEAILGVQVTAWGINKMETKWGACSVDARRIWLNLELAKKPVQCLEYIVVHELTHLLERNHSERFIALMDRHLPNWRVHRKELNAAPETEPKIGPRDFPCLPLPIHLRDQFAEKQQTRPTIQKALLLHVNQQWIERRSDFLLLRFPRKRASIFPIATRTDSRLKSGTWPPDEYQAR
jgi:hypothetical protein